MSKIVEILDGINSFIESAKKKDIYFTNPKSFTRKLLLDLENLCHFMLSNGNRSRNGIYRMEFPEWNFRNRVSEK